MSDHDHLTSDRAKGRDDELFTTPSTDQTPDRHPSILRPGGHASPLKYPAALRPGGARNSRTPSPNNGAPSSPPAKTPRASPSPVGYKAYSPSRPQSPSDELSAQIEGYFTALQVPPLQISKPSELSAIASPRRPPKEQLEQEASLLQRSASPPVPPKEIIDVDKAACAHSDVTDEAEAPPPYEPSQSITPPPEKRPIPLEPRQSSPENAAAASITQVGGDVTVPGDETATSSTTTIVHGPQGAEQLEAETEEDDIYTDAPPPLPPRATPTPVGKGKDPSTSGAFSPPPSRPVPPYKASGAAATSSAEVGGSIAGVGQSAGLRQARKALEKGLGHLLDKAKEHHNAREQHNHAKKTSGRKQSSEGGRKDGESSGSVAQVRLMKP